jgi:hypothetical protein
VTAVLDRPVEVLGATTPRLWTRPLVTGPPGPCGCLCALTPSTSAGFQAVTFAERVLGLTLHPYQRWLLIHMLELRSPGRFRFKTLLILISRQNGKTWIVKVLALFFLYLRGRCLVLGAAQSLDIAKEAWSGAVELAQDVDDLADEIAPNGVRRANGDICLTLDSGSRYRITAATRSAGRGLSVDLLILDELREHRDWGAWGALSKTTTARPGSLIVGISNAGDDQSVVLNSLRGAALAEADDTLGLFEYSAPDGCALDDLDAIAQANPSLNHPNGVSLGAILSALATDPPSVYRTETLCQRVDALDAAVDPAAWDACGDELAPNLGAARERVAACLDVAMDSQHVTLCGAAVLEDGRVRVEVLGAWASTDAARSDLPLLLKRIRPAVFGWFPNGPAAALAADLRVGNPDAVELKGAAVTESCMELADLVVARKIQHPNDPLLNAHVGAATALRVSDGFRFVRRGTGHVDAAYAAAGAVRLALTLPPPVRRHRARIF